MQNPMIGWAFLGRDQEEIRRELRQVKDQTKLYKLKNHINLLISLSPDLTVGVDVDSNPSGYFKTDIDYPQNPLRGLKSSKARCVRGLWIGYIRDKR